MSLDANLFTLNFSPSKEDPNITDLIDPLDNPHYRKERVPGTEYKIFVSDPIAQSLLASATAPSATSKVKFIELHNPSHVVLLKYTGTISFKWRFMWEDHEFEWRREECYILRKPDPAVLVAVTKEQSGRLKTSSVQILDYNINRFDINDRKGLEILILTALLTFQDTNEAYHTATPSGDVTPSTVPRPSFFGIGRRGSEGQSQDTPATPPTLPPKPAPRVGVEKIAEVHAVHAAQGEGEANEVEVGDDGTVEEYAAYAEGLLRDDAMLFVTIRSASAGHVPKVLQVVEHTKRLRHKAGLDEQQELFQYVIYDTATKGPRRINLNDPSPGHLAYSPPTSLKVHLSKIDIPELRPRAEPMKAKAKASPPAAPMRPPEPPAVDSQPGKGKQKETDKAREKERQRAAEKERERVKELEKLQKKAEKAKKADKTKKGAAPEANHQTRPALSVSPNASRPSRPLSFHGPTPPVPSFPQPDYPAYSSASFYSGASFPPPPAHSRSNSALNNMPPPPSSMPGHAAPPPMHPSQLYGSNTFANVPYTTYGSNYLRP